MISRANSVAPLADGNHNNGRGNRKSGTGKYGGDYEAQRHWMEVTLHLPISEWYHYDLEYWGLDYPPLTAYVSWIFGWAADRLGSLHDEMNVDDETCQWNDEFCMERLEARDGGITRHERRGLRVLKDLVALHSSRGFEHPGGKLYMRFTVLLMDLLVYISAVWVLVSRLAVVDQKGYQADKQRTRLLVMALAQPALILIDHRHFQYNTVSLGLALWSFHFMTLHTNPFVKTKGETSSFIGPIIGSFLFTLALNFKQMELYHAPAVFAFLLGRCFRNGAHDVPPSIRDRNAVSRCVMTKFCALGMTVILTFALLWFPFAIYPRSINEYAPPKFQLEGIVQVIKRLFPFQRGLFEGKVSNLWCALSIKPFSIRKRIPADMLPWMALGLTLLLILPPCWFLFCAGRSCRSGHNALDGGKLSTKTKMQPLQQHNLAETRDLKVILWGTAATSLAFFLASFQVHEKGILIPLAPLSLLAIEAPHFTAWFSVVAAWSLWPLVMIDRLNEAYMCCLVIFLCLNVLTPSSPSEQPSGVENLDALSDMYAAKYLVPLSSVAMILFHLAEFFIVPPTSLPDLFPVLWSFVGCGLFCASYLISIWAMAKMSNVWRGPNARMNVIDGKKQNTHLTSMLGVSLLTLAMLPMSHGFHNSRSHVSFKSLGSHNFGYENSGFFSPDILERARIPLFWETQRIDDAKPCLDLSGKDSGALSLSDEAIVKSDEYTGASNEVASSLTVHHSSVCANEWEDGHVWLETVHQLISMGILLNETASSHKSRTKLMTSQAMLDRAPQLVRLPTDHVVESTKFFMTPGQFSLAPLIQPDPSLLTYCADDLYYGIEYLANMMTRGNKTQSVQMLQLQCSISPSMALSLFRMGVDGGIDEQHVSNALGNAARASGKAIELTVGDAGRNYREFKRLKGGKGSLS
ncbi:hypothetical protein HJC23_001418 [Cyclotella cryptica]|uniref:dolichyl-P-Glc:Man9GlcNAc2-PP-dolichol alpha-1,3-glucosyltransferase n=1 Tax=Cyclotella cryptica TaxID=29204 RepID=A0ABD3PFE3_9STRA|eukprot:CCRYP_015642-RA/>CCRYP_015642-RA protein AED:0.10 eAED:0.10 QI:0/-1/0/1/-1/1/1/0/917